VDVEKRRKKKKNKCGGRDVGCLWRSGSQNHKITSYKDCQPVHALISKLAKRHCATQLRVMPHDVCLSLGWFVLRLSLVLSGEKRCGIHNKSKANSKHHCIAQDFPHKKRSTKEEILVKRS